MQKSHLRRAPSCPFLARLLLLFSLVQAGTSYSFAQDTQAQKTDYSGNSQPELQLQKASIDRRLTALQSQLNSWKVLIVPLTSTIHQIEETQAPTVQDFDRLDQAVKKKDYGQFRAAISPIARAYQPFGLRLRFQLLNQQSQQIDPEILLMVNDWDTKLAQVTQPISEEINFLTRALYSEEKPDPGDIQTANLRKDLSPENFQNYKKNFLSVLHSYLDMANQNKEKLTKDADDLQKQSDEIASRLAKGKLEINQLAIELGLPLFCGTVLLMLSIPIIVQTFSRSSNSGEQVRAIFASGILVEIITVLLLTMSILILGLANRIEGPVLGTLLGGISGYVLNRFRGKTQQNGARQEESAGRADDGGQRDGSPPERVRA